MRIRGATPPLQSHLIIGRFYYREKSNTFRAFSISDNYDFINPLQVYCDFHGHSRRKNVFMYGCSVAATNAARQQGNSDTVFFNLVNGDQGEARIEMNTVDDVSGNADEDTGFKVKFTMFITIGSCMKAYIPVYSMRSI